MTTEKPLSEMSVDELEQRLIGATALTMYVAGRAFSSAALLAKALEPAIVRQREIKAELERRR